MVQKIELDHLIPSVFEILLKREQEHDVVQNGVLNRCDHLVGEVL